MQDAKDGNLPLMRGSIGNAVDAVGGIKAFLADQVPDADPDDQTPGQPKFASLQDMLAALDSAAYADSGWSIDVLATAGDRRRHLRPDDEEVNFTIRTTRGGVERPRAEPPRRPHDRHRHLHRDRAERDRRGLQRPAGHRGRRASSVARSPPARPTAPSPTIADANSLTLTADGWSAGQPAERHRLLHRGGRPEDRRPRVRRRARGRRPASRPPTPTSRPRRSRPTSTLTLPMALDLSAPLTYVERREQTVPDCDPSAATAPCPFQQVDASGLGRVITSLPLASDRILLRQSARDLLVADADITSPVQINTSSGFLGPLDRRRRRADRPRPASTSRPCRSPAPATSRSRPSSSRSASRPSAARESADDVFTQTLGGSVDGQPRRQRRRRPRRLRDGRELHVPHA